MKKFLVMIGKIISKLTLSLTFSKTENAEKGSEQPVNIYIDNHLHDGLQKIENITFISDVDGIYADELIENLIVQIKLSDGNFAAHIPVEVGIEGICNFIPKVTDENGIVSLSKLKIKEAGSYNYCIRRNDGLIHKYPIIVRENNVKLKFLNQPQDLASKEVLEKVMVQAIYQSGKKAGGLQILIENNKENVCFSGTKIKFTNKDGIACFDDLIFTKTGNYKLRAICGSILAYSESFHVYAPGINMDFSKCEAGSKEETEAFLTSLLEKQSNGDIIIYNGEEY